MDSFAVDLDKVLDDFEESEDVPVSNGNAHEFAPSVIKDAHTGSDLTAVVKPQYSPLEKLDLSDADFAPSTTVTGPSLADEIRTVVESESLDVNSAVFTNGHVPEKIPPQGESMNGDSSNSNDALCGSSSIDSVANGTKESSMEASHKKLCDERPEILLSASETSHLDDSSNCQPAPVLSDSVQGPQPDLIPTSTEPATTAAAFAACHDTPGDSQSQLLVLDNNHGSVPSDNPSVAQNHEVIGQTDESLSLNGNVHLDVPESDGGSKENLSSDVSQPSTLSSVASSMSSTVSPKHVGTKEEMRCDIDQVDSGISIHSLRADEHSLLPKPAQKPVGFGDIDDDLSEENIDEELEAYLSGMEISANIHRGAQPDISNIVRDTGISQESRNPSNTFTPKSLNLTSINKPGMGPPNATLTFQEGTPGSLHQNPNTVTDQSTNKENKIERQPSAESVEKFLAQAVMSPGISTPMEDAGFSRVPGFTPVESMASLAEELEEPEALKLALEGQQIKNDNHSNDLRVQEDVSNKQNNNVSSNNDQSVTDIGAGQVTEMPPQMAKSPTGVGARPKDPSQMNRKSRPNSLLGLSTPDISVQRPLVTPGSADDGVFSGEAGPIINGASHDLKNDNNLDMQFAQNRVSSLPRDNLTLDIKNQFDSNQFDNNNTTGDQSSNFGIMSPEQHMESVYAGHTPHQPHPPPYHPPQSLVLPASDETNTAIASADPAMLNLGHEQLPDDQQYDPNRQKRPTSLSLMPRGELPPPNMRPKLPDDAFHGPPPDSDSSVASTPVYTLEAPPGAMTPTPTISSNMNIAITELGRVAPRWVPDSEAPNCMQCEARFTFTKRRHHCRACGKVFCSTCCNLRCKIQHMDNKEARVCSKCYQDLIRAQVYDRMHSPNQSSPNPNNPSEYCSTVPPLQQAQGNLNAPPPTVMVPVGVLRKEGSQRTREPKQVMFSDGIRPGGDLTELDSGPEPKPLPPVVKKAGRVAKKVEKTEAGEGGSKSPPKNRAKKLPEVARNVCLIPDDGLPPLVIDTGNKADFVLEENPQPERYIEQLTNHDDPNPIVFAINKNLLVMVKIVNLDCCVDRVCWCFSTKGMCTVGQDEVVIVLECLPNELVIPRDIFCHLHTVYEEANRGNTVSNLSHTIFGQNFLGSKDHSGFLYIRPSFQCLQKLVLPPAPYVFGILLQKWETPWAKVFPVRLMLRLGAEFRYYPCPLISVRDRKPVFGEIGHTIMNLLADFRNYQYMLPQIRGVQIHMEDKKTYIKFPKNKYDEVMKVVNNSNEHVMALGANFSMDADSHLVCIQNDDGNYQTQAINIQNKPRKVTGASFVVFNGALKTTSGLRAKSSIVEDGLMVQILPDSMTALKNALHQMEDYVISCGTVDSQIEEQVIIQWGEDDKNINLGVKSPIDNMVMDGIESIRIHSATDYVGEQRTIRWTEVFFIQNDDQGNSRHEPVDLSRLAETLAAACCMALTQHLDRLKEASLSKIGLRCTFDTEQVGYEVGASGEKLPDYYMNDLDNELIPVIHSAATNSQDGPVCIELIFHVIE